ncbi:MAG: ABC transporter substrate-binding protein [Pseudomonadota bacterium]
MTLFAPCPSTQLNRRHVLHSTAALAVLACGVTPSHAQTKAAHADILFGQSIDLSGPEAKLGREVVRGMNLYFDSVNASGGVNGGKIKLQTLDDAYNVDKAAANVQQLRETPGLLALMTPLGTTTTVRVAKEAGDVPVLFPLTGTAGIRTAEMTNTYFLRATYADEVQRIADHSQTLGMKRLAIIHSEDPFGKPGMAAFEKALATHQLKPHAVGKVADFRSKDVSAAVKTVAASKPDAVLVYLPATFPDVVLALREAGMQSPIYGISVALTPENLDRLGAQRRGLMFTQVVPSYGNRKFRLTREYLAHLEARKMEPSFGSMEGYLNARVAVEALRRAGPEVDRARLRRALESMAPYDAGDLQIQFDAATHTGSKFVQIGIIDRGGQLLN